MTTSEKSRALREWALFTFLAVITGLAGIFMPPFYFIATVVLPIPIILLVLRLDTLYGVLGLAAAGVFLLLCGPEPVPVLVLMFHYGLLGILYGLLFKNNVPSGKNITAGLLGTAVLALLSAGLIYAFTGENPFILSQEGRQMAEQWLAANQSTGAFNDLPPELQGDLGKNVLSFFELFIPGQLIISSVFAAIITYFLARVVLHKVNFTLPPRPVFIKMSFPWYSIWGLIVGLGLTLAGDHFSLQTVAKLGKNILFILFYVYLALGLSVAAYYYYKVNLAKPIKILFIFLAFIYLPISTIIILLLGITDPIINLRR